MVSDKIILLKKTWNVAQSWSPFTIQEIHHKVRVIKQHSWSIRRPGFHTWRGPQATPGEAPKPPLNPGPIPAPVASRDPANPGIPLPLSMVSQTTQHHKVTLFHPQSGLRPWPLSAVC